MPKFQKATPATPVVDSTKTVSMEEFEKLKSQMAAMAADSAILRKAADKKRLASVERKTDFGKVIRVSVLPVDGEKLVVTSWKLIKDYVRATRDGIVEEQEVEITLENDTTVNMSYNDFWQLEKEEVTVDEISTGKNGTKYSFNYNGKEYSILQEFIN